MSAGRELVLLGAGEHGSVVAEAAAAAGWRVLGYFDDAPAAGQPPWHEIPRLGSMAEIPDALGAFGRGVVVHAATGNHRWRERWLDAAGEWPAPAVVHPSAVISPSARLGDGVFIGPGAIVNARAVIDRGVIVNTGVIVEHDCRVGPFAHLAPRVVLAGQVAVGARSLVGTGATVRPGVTIGDGCTIGVGAAVVTDIADGVTAVGVPARAVPVTPDPTEAPPPSRR